MRNMNNFFLSILYVLFLTVFFITNEILCDYYVRLALINSYDNTPYNKYAIYMNLASEKEDYVDLSDLTRGNELYGCALLKYNENNELFNEVIYCDVNAIDIMTEIKHIDFRNRFAVAGCDSGYINGDFVVIEGEEYFIEGILSKHISNAVNKGVFYCNGNISKVPIEEVYVLAAKEERYVLSGYNKFREFLSKRNIRERRIEITRAKFADYIGYEKMMNGLILILSVFYIVFIFALRNIWLKLHYSEIYILSVLGYKNIKCRVNGEYILTWVSAYMASLVLFAVFCYDMCMDYKSVFSVATTILLLGLLSSINLYRGHRYIM